MLQTSENSIQIFTELLSFSIIKILNKLEQIKANPEKDVDITVQKIIEIEMELSEYYLLLGEILKISYTVYCDCLLTAFSLSPKWDNYFALKDLLKCKKKLRNNYGTKSDPLYSILRKSIYDDIVTVIMRPRMKNLQWMNGCQETLNQCKLLAINPHEKYGFLKRSLKKYPSMNEINRKLMRDLIYEKEFQRLIKTKEMHAKKSYAVLFDEDNVMDVIGFVPYSSSISN